MWSALTTSHSALAEVAGGARRFPDEVSPFCAVDVLDDRAWHDLGQLVGPGGTAVLFRRSDIEAPPGWAVVLRGVGHQMVAGDLTAGPEIDARPLVTDDVPQMLELVDIARPGPFAPRTIELGGYHGVFDGDRLVAMAGERLHLPGFAEISAVCTHPDARGRGLGAGLTALVAGRIARRGERPFLHVADGNPAQSLYEQLGFRMRTAVSFAALQAPSDPSAPSAGSRGIATTP